MLHVDLKTLPSNDNQLESRLTEFSLNFFTEQELCSASYFIDDCSNSKKRLGQVDKNSIFARSEYPVIVKNQSNA